METTDQSCSRDWLLPFRGGYIRWEMGGEVARFTRDGARLRYVWFRGCPLSRGAAGSPGSRAFGSAQAGVATAQRHRGKRRSACRCRSSHCSRSNTSIFWGEVEYLAVKVVPSVETSYVITPRSLPSYLARVSSMRELTHLAIWRTPGLSVPGCSLPSA